MSSQREIQTYCKDGYPTEVIVGDIVNAELEIRILGSGRVFRLVKILPAGQGNSKKTISRYIRVSE